MHNQQNISELPKFSTGGIGLSRQFKEKISNRKVCHINEKESGRETKTVSFSL